MGILRSTGGSKVLDTREREKISFLRGTDDIDKIGCQPPPTVCGNCV